MRKQVRGLVTVWALGAAAVLTAMVLTTATYAWFTVNRKVETGRVTSTVGSAALELRISRTGPDNFRPGTATDASGNSVNQVELIPCDKELMPVSTADLQTFLYCPITDGNAANRFLPTPDEGLYYHDTVYLMAEGRGFPDGTQMELYLDNNTEKPIIKSDDGKMLKVARLGFSFNGTDPVIVKFSEETAQGGGNTVLDGVPLGGGQVLAYENGTVKAVRDPAVLLRDVQFAADNANRTPLTTLTIGQVYRVDVFFYIEGCDPDCMDDQAGMAESDLNLAFFGLPVQQGAGA